jgi:hypothetical protein
MANLFESGTFTTAADLLAKMDAFLVNIAGYTRNMAPTVDNTFGTGSRAHYQRTHADGRTIFINLKSLSAMLNSTTYVPDGISANISDGYSAAVQWHLQPGYPKFAGSGRTESMFVSGRIVSSNVTAKPYDFYTDGYNCILYFATGATASVWSTATYYYKHAIIFGFMDDAGCGTGFTASGGSAGTFCYGRVTTSYGSTYNGMREDDDLQINVLDGSLSTYLRRSAFICRVKSGTLDGYATSYSNYGTAPLAASFNAGRVLALQKASTGHAGYCGDYMACPDTALASNYGAYGQVTNTDEEFTLNGFFPTNMNAGSSLFNTVTGKFFAYQPLWFVRDEATLRWFNVGRFPLVYVMRADTTNFLPKHGSITVAGQDYNIHGDVWVKKLTA